MEGLRGDLWMVLNGDLEKMRVGEKGLVMRGRKGKVKREGKGDGWDIFGFMFVVIDLLSESDFARMFFGSLFFIKAFAFIFGLLPCFSMKTSNPARLLPGPKEKSEVNLHNETRRIHSTYKSLDSYVFKRLAEWFADNTLCACSFYSSQISGGVGTLLDRNGKEALPCAGLWIENVDIRIRYLECGWNFWMEFDIGMNTQGI